MPLNVNPIEIINSIRNGQNLQQLMIKILEDQMGSTPMGENLLTLVKQGRTDEIERIARNAATAQGLDFDKEFNAFKKKFGL